MENRENKLLKAGSLCILIGGIVTGIASIVNAAATMLAMSLVDEDTMAGINEYALQESEGMFGSGEVIGVVNAVVIVVIVFAAVLMVIDIAVGIMGLSRSRNPQKYRFFLGWGIALLVLGVLGLGQLLSLRGLCAAVSGIVGPLLYIIGGVQQNRAANLDSFNNT